LIMVAELVDEESGCLGRGDLELQVNMMTLRLQILRKNCEGFVLSVADFAGQLAAKIAACEAELAILKRWLQEAPPNERRQPGHASDAPEHSTGSAGHGVESPGASAGHVQSPRTRKSSPAHKKPGTPREKKKRKA
jgi:hypothetical protein